MKTVADAQRIISLLPGATEWVCQLGLADRLVAISHECDFPDAIRALPRVTRSKIDSTQSSREIDNAVKALSDTKTSLYELDQGRVRSLKPDLILTQTLCNVCAVNERDVLRCIDDLEQQCEILDLPGTSLTEVLDDSSAIWKATGRSESGIRARKAIDERIDRVRQTVEKRYARNQVSRPKVTLLEWLDPLYCSGHWTPQLIDWAGGVDPIGQTSQPSRVLSLEKLASVNPDILLVACCGMSEQRTRGEWDAVTSGKHAADNLWLNLDAVCNQHVYHFDGSALFNRPGPRLIDALEAVTKIVEDWHAAQV